MPLWHDTGMVHPEPGSKRHAVRKGDPDSPLYWVGNDEDWREVRRRPRVALECPERCGVELVSVENAAYLYAPRFFRVKPRAMLETCGSAGKGAGVKEGVPSR